MTVCICAMLLAAATAAGEPAASVNKLLADQQAAWNRGDLEGYMAGYWRSPELSFFSGSTKTRGWEPTLARYRKRYQEGGGEMGRLDFSQLEVEPLGEEAALARGRWHLTFADASGAGGVFTLLLRKLEGGFRIVHDHSSGDSEPAPPLPHRAGSLTVVVGGRQRAVTLEELKAMSPSTVSWSDMDGPHKARGVPLDRVLAAQGFKAGPMGEKMAPADKRPGYKRIAIASAADGFEAVFTLAELAEEMGPTRALVVWEVDGKPLPDDRGPLRLVVPTDKEPSRAVYQMERVEVVEAKRR